MSDHYGALVIFLAVFALYTWGLVSAFERFRRRREQAAWVRHWHTTPRDGRSPAERTFDGIVAQLEREGTA